MFCKSKSIKCKVIIFILFILFMGSIILGKIYKPNNTDTLNNPISKDGGGSNV